MEGVLSTATVSQDLEMDGLDRAAARIGKTGIHKSHALLMHEATELRGRNAPLPENYPYQRRIARNRYETRKQELQIELLKV